MSDDHLSNIFNLPVTDIISNSVKESHTVDDISHLTQEDFKYTRDNIASIIEKGHSAISELMNIASQSQNPRAYEVLSSLIKTLLDANKDLIDIHKKNKEITGQKAEPEKVVNNNLYVGSTSDLAKMLENYKNDK